MQISPEPQQSSEPTQYFAQVHSPLTEEILRVAYTKGDTVRELVEAVCTKWSISSKNGWFPALFFGERYEGYQLLLNDEIPCDPASFVKEHEKEFAWGNWDAARRGLKKYRQYGDITSFVNQNHYKHFHYDFEVPEEWKSDDIHIYFVVKITGG